MGNRIPILAYHSIDDSGSVISTSPERFRFQMQHLRDESFNVMSLEDVVKCLRDKVPLPPRSVSITFDDGFDNLYSVAYPILKSCGFTATIFLVAGYCGKNNRWRGQPEGIPILDLLDWGRIREMADEGFDFGAHTMGHADLSTLPIEQAREEIVNSKLMIQERLGKPVQFFVYPYGITNREIEAIVRMHFQGACGVNLGFANMGSNIYELPRIEMFYFSNNNFFKSVGTPIFSAYIFSRRTLRSVRRKITLPLKYSRPVGRTIHESM